MNMEQLVYKQVEDKQVGDNKDLALQQGLGLVEQQVELEHGQYHLLHIEYFYNNKDNNDN